MTKEADENYRLETVHMILAYDTCLLLTTVSAS